MHDWKATADQLGGIGRSSVFQLWASGQLGSVTIGRRRFSTDSQIAKFKARLEAASDRLIDDPEFVGATIG